MTMKTTHEQNLLAAALACALGATAACARTQSGFYRPLTLARADATSSGGGGAEADAADQQAELARKLQNPVANLVSVPIQNNWDFRIGPANAMKYPANIQPVVPVSSSEDWDLIVRTILLVIYAESPVKGGTGTLKVDGKTVDSHTMAHSLGGSLPWCETFSVGIDTSTSVEEKDYQVPFAFTGKLNKLTVKLGPKQVSPEDRARLEKKMCDRQ